jgi:aspartate kinase
MIVMKFGGTSVQDAAAINRVADIVRSKLDLKPTLVVSAMARVTDALLGIAGAANERRFEEAARLIAVLADRHLHVARELLAPGKELESVESSIGSLFAELAGLARSVATLGELTSRSQDAISSFGERLSSMMLAAAFRSRGIPADLVDSRDLLVTDSNFTAASPDMLQTERRVRARLLPLISEGRVPVAQGFIGSTPEGVTTTIGRGGSDYSAAIIGATLGVDSIEIWTDVDGLMTADPRIVAGARRIRVVSFDEAAELSYFGAKVLHPSTVLPAIERRIPVHIFNTNNPSCEGTVIAAEPRRSLNTIKSIAVKRGVTIINVASTQMIMAHGFLRTLFEVFDRHQTSIDVVTTSETSVSMTLDNTDRLEPILEELKRIGEVNVDPAKAIVCVVGDNLKFTPGVAARLFRALGDINVNMISQGASVINLTFVINDREIEKAIGLLHADFFRECDPAVFA